MIWNGVLTFELVQLKDNQTTSTNTTDTKVINQTVTQFTTDVTKVVADSTEKVVGVTSLVSGEVYATGSGAIYSVENKKAYIITNNHVIAESTGIEVTFANGQQLTAKLVGSDTYTDLALLEVTIDFDVKAFTSGDSSLVKVGEYVLAIGSPLGLEFQGSVTMGIISGKDRIVAVDLDGDGVDDWDSIVLQTDAAINPGNSGGPLINMAGELIGITSMKIADSSVEGMGFAIPINEVIPIITQLKETGKVIRPVVGISAVSLDELSVYQKSYYGIQLDLTSGLYISSLTDLGPAVQAGLKVGDIITYFDGAQITSFKQFRKILYTKKVGDKVEVTVSRDSKIIKVTVTLQ